MAVKFKDLPEAEQKARLLLKRYAAKQIDQFLIDRELDAASVKTLKDMVKESNAVIKTITDGKFNFKEIKQKVDDFEAKALDLEAKIAKAGNGQPKIKHSFDSAVMAGLKDLFKKGSLAKLQSRELMNLNIFTSKHSLIDGNGKFGKKVDNPMSEGTSVVPIGSGIPFSLATFEPGLTRVSRRKPFIVELVNQAKTLSKYIAWVEQTNVDPGNAATTAEGGAALAGSFRWTEASTIVKKITHFTKVTKEMLDDLALVQNEVRTELIDIMTLKLDAQVLNGGGTGNDFKGILQYAQAFSATINKPGGGTNAVTPVTAANNYDVLIKAILQIQANGSTTPGLEELINIFEPTDIVLHPSDYVDMKLTKDSLNRYVQQFMPDFGSGDDGFQKFGDVLQGLRITTNIGMTQGSFLVMDANKSNVRIREDATIALGYENTDFTDGLVMIRGELRAAHYIKANHVNAFVSDTFANAKAILAPTP